MNKPDLERMWETFIKISPVDFLDVIRFKAKPVIFGLRDKNIIDWFCFLIHDRNSGVPTSQDDNDAYFHIRVALRKMQSLVPFRFEHGYQETFKSVDVCWNLFFNPISSNYRCELYNFRF